MVGGIIANRMKKNTVFEKLDFLQDLNLMNEKLKNSYYFTCFCQTCLCVFLRVYLPFGFSY